MLPSVAKPLRVPIQTKAVRKPKWQPLTKHMKSSLTTVSSMFHESIYLSHVSFFFQNFERDLTMAMIPMILHLGKEHTAILLCRVGIRLCSSNKVGMDMATHSEDRSDSHSSINLSLPGWISRVNLKVSASFVSSHFCRFIVFPFFFGIPNFGYLYFKSRGP